MRTRTRTSRFNKFFKIEELVHPDAYRCSWEHTPTLVAIIREYIDGMARAHGWRETLEITSPSVYGYDATSTSRYDRYIDILTHVSLSKFGEDDLRDVDERIRLLNDVYIDAQMSLLFTLLHVESFEKGTF